MIAGLILGRLPPGLVLAAVASLLEIGGGAWFGHHLTAQHYQAQIAQADAERARAVAAAASAAQAETSRRIAAQQEITDDTRQALATARADADRADRAAAGLRLQLGAYVSAGRAGPRDPAATAGSPAATDALGVLADVLRLADDRAGALAAAADAARAAGIACERSYDALTAARP